MKAAICTKYGPPEVIQLKEVNRPTPKDNEVLIKIMATTVTSGDARIRSFNVPLLFWLPYRLVSGFTKPRLDILGTSFSGEIEAVGKDVQQFKIGDAVFGSSNDLQGCHAQYTCLPADGIIAKKLPQLSHAESAAMFFGGHTALHFLRKGNIQSGDQNKNVLIYGASGCVGTYAVQLAKYFGAECTAVCSTRNIELVESLGADFAIDYKKEDFTKNRKKYDIIFDTVGKSSFSGCIKSLDTNGHYLRAVHLYLIPMIRGIWISMMSSKKVIGGVAHEKVEDLHFLKKLVEYGHIRPIIDMNFPLAHIVEAHKYVDSGHKRGSVVITIDHTD
jgi:NADPH:quinone reductase-like Zn-dependent oxidoreductase